MEDSNEDAELMAFLNIDGVGTKIPRIQTPIPMPLHEQVLVPLQSGVIVPIHEFQAVDVPRESNRQRDEYIIQKHEKVDNRQRQVVDI